MREYVRSAKEPSVSRCLLITAPSDSGQRELTRLRAQISSFTAHVRPANTMFAIYFAHRDLRILLDTRLSKLSQRHQPFRSPQASSFKARGVLRRGRRIPHVTTSNSSCGITVPTWSCLAEHCLEESTYKVIDRTFVRATPLWAVSSGRKHCSPSSFLFYVTKCR